MARRLWCALAGCPESLHGRAGVEPNGQALPDYLSWSSFVTTIDGQATTTGDVVILPLTYFGPSIPLGSGWVYGGLSSPVTSPTSSSAATSPLATSSIFETSLTITSATVASSTPQSSSTSSSPLSTTPSATSSILVISSSVSSSSLSSSPSSSTTPSSSLSSSSTSTSSALSSISSTSSSLLTLATSSVSSSVTTTSDSNPHSTPTLPPASRIHLSTVLPALLLPLLAVVLLILLLAWLYRRHKQGQDLQSPNDSSRRWPQIFGKAPWAAVPTTTAFDEKNPGQQENPSGQETNGSDERSALLERTSENGTSGPGGTVIDAGVAGTAILDRMRIGLGRHPSTNSRQSGRSSSSGRVISGNTMEKIVGLVQTGRSGDNGSGSSGITTNFPVAGASTGSYMLLRDDGPLLRNQPTIRSSGEVDTGTAIAVSSPIPHVSHGSIGSRSSRSTYSHASRSLPSSHSGGRAHPSIPEDSTFLPGSVGFDLGVPESDSTISNSLTSNSSKAPSKTGSMASKVGADVGEFGVRGKRRSRWRLGGERLRFPIPPSTSVPSGGNTTLSLQMERNLSGGTFGGHGNDDAEREEWSAVSASTEFLTAASHTPRTVRSTSPSQALAESSPHGNSSRSHLSPLRRPYGPRPQQANTLAEPLPNFSRDLPPPPSVVTGRPLSGSDDLLLSPFGRPRASSRLVSPLSSPLGRLQQPLSPIRAVPTASRSLADLFTVSPPPSASGEQTVSAGQLQLAENSQQERHRPALYSDFGVMRDLATRSAPALFIHPDRSRDGSLTATVWDTAHSGSSGSMLASSTMSTRGGEVEPMSSLELVSEVRAIRGRRSQPQLIESSQLTPSPTIRTPEPVAFGDRSPEILREESPEQRSSRWSWFRRS